MTAISTSRTPPPVPSPGSRSTYETDNYHDWQHGHDVARAIVGLPELLIAANKARGKLSDEDSEELDAAYDSAMGFFADHAGVGTGILPKGG